MRLFILSHVVLLCSSFVLLFLLACTHIILVCLVTPNDVWTAFGRRLDDVWTTFGEDGLIDLSASYVKLTSDGKLAILQGWTDGSRFVIED